MIYQDKIYGKIEINEPVIQELFKTPSILRLKEIDQGGYTEPFFPKKSFSRFEHSVGVMILLKKFGAKLEEQIAGLIHDISHTVFSHCADYALDDGSEKEQSYQDNIFENFIQNSEIPKILKKYNLDVNYILNDKNFPLEERELPDLCADRIDYSLRTSFHYREINKKEVDYFLENLEIKNNFWVFNNFYSAQKYAELFLKLNRVYFAGFPSAVMFKTVGDCVRYALKHGYLSQTDLFTTDKDVLEKIKTYSEKDFELKLFFERMDGKTKIENNPKNYNVSVFCKSRIVNPLFRDGKVIKRLSEINNNWQKILQKELQPKKYFLKF